MLSGSAYILDSGAHFVSNNVSMTQICFLEIESSQDLFFREHNRFIFYYTRNPRFEQFLIFLNPLKY
jgi:hypothetical protein